MNLNLKKTKINIQLQNIKKKKSYCICNLVTIVNHLNQQYRK